MSNMISEAKAYEILENATKISKQKYAIWVEAAQSEYEKANGKKMGWLMESAICNNLKATEERLRMNFGNAQVDAYFNKLYKRESATTPANIDKFIDHAFTMITAMLPANPLNEVVSMQSTDARMARIFFYNLVRGNTKGSQTAGTNYLSANDGPNTGQDFSNEKIDIEELYSGDSSTLAFSDAILGWGPVQNKNDNFGDKRPVLTYVIGSTSFSTSANSSNQFVDATNIQTATINLTTRAVNVTFKAGKAPDTGSNVTIMYYYDSAREDVTGVPEIISQFTEQYVPTQPRRLNVKWMIDAALMAGKEHGQDIEQEMVNDCLAGVMNETAVEVFNDLYNVATANPGGLPIGFDKTPPSLSIPYTTHRLEILKTLSDGGAEIEDLTQKVTANFVIGGKEFIKVVKGLPRDIFSPVKFADQIPVGTHMIGELDNQYKIMQNFNYTANKFTLGAKGQNWLTTGYVYITYIPLMTTPVNWEQSGAHWRQLLTYYGKKVVNGNFYTQGVITES